MTDRAQMVDKFRWSMWATLVLMAVVISSHWMGVG